MEPTTAKVSAAIEVIRKRIQQVRDRKELIGEQNTKYGRGYGFRDRVAAHFENWFDDPAQSGVLEPVEAALAEQWSSCFAANVEKLVASMRPGREAVGAQSRNEGQ